MLDVLSLEIKSEGLVRAVSVWLGQGIKGMPAAGTEELLSTLWSFDLRLTLGSTLWMSLINGQLHWAWEGAPFYSARSKLEWHVTLQLIPFHRLWIWLSGRLVYIVYWAFEKWLLLFWIQVETLLIRLPGNRLARLTNSLFTFWNILTNWLNVYIPSKFICWNPSPRCDGIRDLKGCALIPFHHENTARRVSLHQEVGPCWNLTMTLISHFHSTELCEIIFCCL